MEATMNYVSLNRERLILNGQDDRIVTRRATGWDRVVAFLTDPELVAITLFCLIGLLLTLVAAREVPDFGALVQSLQQFL
jgi:hypothetical protein